MTMNFAILIRVLSVFFRSRLARAFLGAAIFACSIPDAAASLTASAAPNHYRGNQIPVSVSATTESWETNSGGNYDSRGNYYTWGSGGIGAFLVYSHTGFMDRTAVVGGPQSASSIVMQRGRLPVGFHGLYITVCAATWVDGHWDPNGYYDEEGNWVDEEESWVAPAVGEQPMEWQSLGVTVLNGGSTSQSITWTNPPPSLWPWNDTAPFQMAATCTSGNQVQFDLVPGGRIWAFTVPPNGVIQYGGYYVPDWIGDTVTVVAEAPASATHAYTTALYTITLDRGRAPVMPSPIIVPTLSNNGLIGLFGVVYEAALLANTPPRVAPEYELLAGGGDIENQTYYRANGYVGNVTIRTRYPATVNYYPSNYGFITFATAVPTQPPAITSQPSGSSVWVGATVSFSVTATGAPAPTYQWRKNGADLAGATAATLTLANVWSTDAGTYVAVAANSTGTVPSNPATLIVAYPPPVITGLPSGRIAYADEAESWHIVASGTGLLTYQWRKNGVAIAGATTATLSFAALQSSDAGNYSVVVGSAYGSTTSTAFALTVNPPRPSTITSAPSAAGTINTPFSYSFSAYPAATSYVWVDGSLPNGLTRFGAGQLIQGTPSETGVFPLTFWAWGAGGPGPLFTLTITVNGGGPNQIAPTITIQPTSRTITAGTDTILSVGVSGPGPIAYEWRKNGSVVPGEAYSSLFVTNASANHVGSYTVKVSNSFGWVVSVPALVTVTGAGGSGLAGPPVISRHPQSQAVRPGGNPVLSVDATSALPYTYQWRKGGVALAGQTNADLAVLGFTSNDADFYNVVVANDAGSVTSDAAAFTLDQYAQEIRFLPLPNRAFPVFDATTTITLKAVATSLLPVTFSVVSGPATVAGTVLTVTGAGLITVRAHQAGALSGPTGTYSPASLDREFTVVQGTPPAEPSAAFSMLSDNKRSGTRIRALSVSAPEPVWFDIDRDGYLDEIIPVGVGGFEVLASVDTDYTQMVLDAAAMAATLENMWRSGYWSPFWSDNFSADSPRAGADAGWVRVANISTLSLTADYDIFFNLAYRFTPEPGQEYVIFGEYGHRWGDRVENWPADSLRVRRTYGSPDLEAGQAILSVQEASAQSIEMLSVPYYVIRKGKPFAAATLSIGGTSVGIGVSGSNVGPITLPLPAGGSATVNLGTGTGSITIGGTTVSVGSGGAVTVNGVPPVVVTGEIIAGITGQIDGTGVTLSIPEVGGILGTTVHVNPDGSGSIVLSNGAGISVSRTGQVSLKLPNGTSQVLVGAVDILGKVLQGGKGAAVSVRDVLGVIGAAGVSYPMPNGVLDDIDVRIRSVGSFEIGIKQSNDQFFWIAVTMPSSARLLVDANRDGTIAVGETSTAAAPYRFWLNDDIDRGHTVDGTDYEQDDISPTEAATNSWVEDWKYNTVQSKRDLEDFSRIVISAGGLGSDLYLGLKWTDVTGAPSLKLYKQYDAGTTYLTDDLQASLQLPEKAILNQRYPNDDVNSMTAHTVVTPGDLFVLPQTLIDSLGRGSMLFEGCTAGKGQLKLVILRKDGANYTEIGDGPGVWLDLKNVKDMYEHWTVGQGPVPYGGGAPGALSPASNFTYTAQSPEESKYVLFVHGWNMEPWEKERFAETAYKRLYWQGYKGRFGLFSWPTTNGFEGIRSAITDSTNYDRGEFSAWRSANLLAQKLAQLNGQYPSQVYLFAHSMGNVVVGEALRRAGQDGLGVIVRTYVASQAALPVHCYNGSLADNLDADVPASGVLRGLDGGWPQTANAYKSWLAANSAAVAKRVNFFNINDYALWRDIWQLNQWLKPDHPDFRANPPDPQRYYYYLDDFNQPPTQDGFGWRRPGGQEDSSDRPYLNNTWYAVLRLGNAVDVKDRYEIMSMASESRSKALGATSFNEGLDASLWLGSIWPADPSGDARPYSRHKWHSAQFRSTNMLQKGYWQALLGPQGFNIVTPP